MEVTGASEHLLMSSKIEMLTEQVIDLQDQLEDQTRAMTKLITEQFEAAGSDKAKRLKSIVPELVKGVK